LQYHHKYFIEYARVLNKKEYIIFMETVVVERQDDPEDVLQFNTVPTPQVRPG
jgi:hypothetical protein